MASIMELGGDKPNRARAKVRSGETTITILKGSPVFYQMNATRDGLAAISSEQLAAASQGLFAGIAMSDIAPGKFREIQTAGLCDYVRVITATRAASTDVWASYSAGALGDALSINSGSNTVGVQALSRAGAGSAGVFPMFVLVGTYVSATTQASSLAPAGNTVSVTAMKVFIRSL